MLATFPNKDLSVFGLTPRDLALVHLGEFDFDAQLLAIKDLLRRNRVADEQLALQIAELERDARSAGGERLEHLIDVRIEHLQASVYQDAAHSMAAVGMLAPFLEGLFDAAFVAVRRSNSKDQPLDFAGTRAAHVDDPDFWRCRIAWGSSGPADDIARGIVQLAECVGLGTFLPADLSATLKALFTYRNRMFHLGFEWPLTKRTSFEELIVAEGWPPEWFERATHNSQPWIIYLSDVMIAHCLDTIEAILVGLGRFLELRFAERSRPRQSDQAQGRD